MVEISMSGSGEGPGRVTGRGYSTGALRAMQGNAAGPRCLQRCNDEPGWPHFVLLGHLALFGSVALEC
jgi:hypothetical protein